MVGGSRHFARVGAGKEAIKEEQVRVAVDTRGEFMWLPKDKLYIDHSYQREMYVVPGKISRMTANWSWGACGVLTVVLRDGVYYAVDGQNRIQAALRRRDILTLPCMVFPSQSIEYEAALFFQINCHRKMPTAYAQFRALLRTGDSVCRIVQDVCDEYEISLSGKRSSTSSLGCTVLLRKIAANDPQVLRTIIATMKSLCGTEHPMNDRFVNGLYYLHLYCTHKGSKVTIFDSALLSRLHTVGYSALAEGARLASIGYVKGGDKIFARGFVNAMNKGVKTQYSLE